MSHKQFNRVSRLELAALLKSGLDQKACGEILEVDRSNVCKEIARNKDPDGVYRGFSAHQRAQARRKGSKQKYRKIENDDRLQRYVIDRIKKYWSPEQIAGRLRKEKQIILCHETIYKFVYKQKPELVRYLRHQKCKYRKRRGSHARMALNKASKVKMIDERSSEVNDRERIGDWEDDTLIGQDHKGRIWTCVERKTGLGMAEKLESASAENLHRMICAKFKPIPKKKKHTLTRDNGCEFGDYDRMLERKTRLEVFRAHPHHPWERGVNENWNGLLRQFFPKGSSFANINATEVERAVKLLNNRPRKRLGYATPKEEFKKSGDSD